ncbi:hypothetical protein PVAG01_11187 [Phlyctema vagabunda]|uniref:Uncharacterized protein n=1 Tax=Phlyctema vagabunda TaxID=108571 RepID=A0ABR4P1W7_9HELO
MKFTIPLPTLLLLLGTSLAAHATNLDVDASRDMEINFDLPLLLHPRTLTNLQAFTGALGGAAAPAITNSGDSQRPFEVDGDTFTDFKTAAERACNNQKNSCAKIANDGKDKADFKVSDCDEQNSKCQDAASSSSTIQNFQVLASQDAEFDYICDGPLPS